MAASDESDFDFSTGVMLFFFQHNNLYNFYKFFEKLCFYLFQNCDGSQGTNAYQSVGLVTHKRQTYSGLFQTSMMEYFCKNS